MKFKTTAKAIRENSIDPVTLGYCDAQYLFRNHSPIAYASGIYGWNFDVYEIGGKTFCTGYRGMVGRSPRVSVSEWEKKAEKIWSWENKASYEEKCAEVEKLLDEFLKVV